MKYSYFAAVHDIFFLDWFLKKIYFFFFLSESFRNSRFFFYICFEFIIIAYI